VRSAWALFLIAAVSLQAQERRGSSLLTGTVFTDVGGVPVIGAEVAILAHGLSALTGSTGAYRLGRIPAGEHEVIVRRLGYTLLTHTMTFELSDTLRRAFYLNRPQTLDTITVAERSAIPSFEEHRALGLGKFLTRAELEKLESVTFPNVVRQMNGLDLKPSRIANVQWAVAGRTRVGGDIAPSQRDSIMFQARPACYTTVYLDRMRVYTGKDGEPLFNLSSVQTSAVEAVEFYSGTASIPQEYAIGDMRCGVLVIHTRRFEPKKK
jgi:hypothetical protein